MRLDQYIAQKLWVSRNRAQFFISQSKISVNNKIVQKDAYQVEETDVVDIKIDEVNYVSRSALKLKWLLENNNIEVQNLVCIDVWASTGWFTQVLLEKWARKVYTIDVGTSQLHEKLKWNRQIISIENTDIRKFDKNLLQEEIDLIVCDVSFISLKTIIDAILDLMDSHTKAILLFKPQFEVGSENLTKLWVAKNFQIVKEKFDDFCLILRKKSVQILLIETSSLSWENGNEEIFLIIHKIELWH